MELRMSIHPFLRMLPVIAACALPPAASAQTVLPDPLDAKAGVPALRHQSAFARYKPLGEDKPVAWRQANDTVTGIGGWRAYARQAQQPETPPPAAAGAGKP
jgi:hypothetical protein